MRTGHADVDATEQTTITNPSETSSAAYAGEQPRDAQVAGEVDVDVSLDDLNENDDGLPGLDALFRRQSSMPGNEDAAGMPSLASGPPIALGRSTTKPDGQSDLGSTDLPPTFSRVAESQQINPDLTVRKPFSSVADRSVGRDTLVSAPTEDTPPIPSSPSPSPSPTADGDTAAALGSAALEFEEGTVELTEADLDHKIEDPGERILKTRGIGRRSSIPPPPKTELDASRRSSIAHPPDRRGTLTPWYERVFEHTYQRTVWPPNQQQLARKRDFVEDALGGKEGRAILDVGCGGGSLAVELASRGHRVVGLDLSLSMISRAAVEAKDRDVSLQLLHADVRALQFDQQFDAVLCLDTTFGYFDDRTNRKVIEGMQRALRHGGVLIMDVLNRDHVIEDLPHLCWFEGEDCVCMEEAHFDFMTSRLEVKRTIMEPNGQQTESAYSIRLYSAHELCDLLRQEGLLLTQMSGSEATAGVFLGSHSPRIMAVAVKPQDVKREPTGAARKATHSIPVADDPTLVVTTPPAADPI